MRARVGNTRARTLLAALTVVVTLAVSGVVAYRVFAPAEVVTPARAGYPAPAVESPGVLGTLNAAPIIVDGRLRVFAAPRQVRAERPVNALTRRTPFWSYRRWPEQLVGIAVVGATVLSRWSDGELIGLDAATGRVSWRVAGPAPDRGYIGRSTGAATVYDPPGLRTATTADGRSVLVVIGTAGRRGYDPATGREMWRDQLDSRCWETTFTTSTGQLVSVDRCVRPQVVALHDAWTGAGVGRWRPEGAGQELTITPVGCAVGRSACPAMRTGGAGNPRGWIFDAEAGTTTSEPVAAPVLDRSDSTVLGRPETTAPDTTGLDATGLDAMAIVPEGSELVARSVRTGSEVWRWDADGPWRLLAVQPGRIHLRTDSGELVTLDAADGRERSRFPLTYGRDRTTWSPGYVYAAAGFLAVERLAEPVDPNADDRRYFLSIQPVIFAAT